MATATSSDSSIARQAGPLPTKRGEIGFTEDLHSAAEAGRASSPLTLPARHPADRDNDDTPTPPGSPSGPNNNDSSATPSDSSSTNTVAKPRFLKFLKRKKVMALAGLRYTTLIAFVVQATALGGTIAGWVLVANKFLDAKDTPASRMAGISSSIFVHVVFAIALLGQLIFLERRVFMLRGQRYTFKHPGQTLPSSRYIGLGQDPAVGWAPWNRPSLPSYAAALAQSGVGTGDVEDHIIAQPPPPAYGNTRGSTLVLQGFLRNSLGLQRSSSTRSAASQRSRLAPVIPTLQIPQGRPLSYRSVDSSWEAMRDADRALQLEETLVQLERPAAAHTRSTGQN